MLSSIFRNVSGLSGLSAAAALAVAVGISTPAAAQPADDEAEATEADEAGEQEPAPGTVDPTEVMDETDENVDAETEPAPTQNIKVEAGAPRPPTQTPGIAPPQPPPNAPPPPPTIKLGGAFILAYFQPYNMAEEADKQGRPRPKANFETFRAAILLDSKIDRYGVHIEFRARDKRVRDFFESTAWLEEIYGSVDIMRPENPLGSIQLKVGKSFAQFGRFWDDSFYGNVHLRDGLKLDSNYGLSLEGQIGKRQIGAKFYGQYFILDGGGTNTSLTNRDTISVPAPNSGYTPLPYTGTSTPNPVTGQAHPAPMPLGRKRNMFVARVEPFYAFNPVTAIKIAGSISNFTADFGPTRDQENVLRYGGDITANLAWFSAWAEYTVQKGMHTLNYPFPPRGTALQGYRGAENNHYLLAGGRFFWKGMMLRYNFSRVQYKNVSPFPDTALAGINRYNMLASANVSGDTDVEETMHVPGIMVTATPQLFLFIEAPIHRRSSPAINIPAALNQAGIPSVAKSDIVIDRSIVVTLHARI